MYQTLYGESDLRLPTAVDNAPALGQSEPRSNYLAFWARSLLGLEVWSFWNSFLLYSAQLGQVNIYWPFNFFGRRSPTESSSNGVFWPHGQRQHHLIFHWMFETQLDELLSQSGFGPTANTARSTPEPPAVPPDLGEIFQQAMDAWTARATEGKLEACCRFGLDNFVPAEALNGHLRIFLKTSCRKHFISGRCIHFQCISNPTSGFVVKLHDDFLGESALRGFSGSFWFFT